MSRLLLIGLVLLFISPALGWSFSSLRDSLEEHAFGLVGLSSGSCSYTREQALYCFTHFVDTKKQGYIDEEELRFAIDNYAPKALSKVRWAASWLINALKIDTIFKDCDYDKDGKLTPEDFRKSVKTCLPTQWDLCQVKTACERAQAAQIKAAKNEKHP